MGKNCSKQLVSKKEIEKNLKKILEILEKSKKFTEKKRKKEKRMLKLNITEARTIKTKEAVNKIRHLIKITSLVSAFDILLYYAHQILNNSRLLELAQKNKENPDIEKIKPLTTAIMSLIWSSHKLKLEDLTEFAHLIKEYFSENIVVKALKGKNVDPVVRKILKLMFFNS